MTISMYKASVPVFRQMLLCLSAILDKTAAHAAAKKIEPEALLTARLYPDMFTFTRQVQLATDFAKSAVSRLSGLEPPKWEDNEKSFDELKARVAKALAFLDEFKPSQIDGSEDKDISFPGGGGTRHFKGEAYLLTFIYQHFFFHVTTAYAILRHNGIEIGKGDYMRPPAK